LTAKSAFDKHSGAESLSNAYGAYRIGTDTKRKPPIEPGRERLQKMKQYVIDQLRESDYDQIADYLDKHTEKTALEGIYWVGVPRELYSAVQLEHTGCHPYYFAVNLSHRQVAFELLIRSRQIIRCNCIGYAGREQRDYILRFADDMLNQLDIKI